MKRLLSLNFRLLCICKGHLEYVKIIGQTSTLRDDFLLLISQNCVVSVQRSFLFLLVVRIGCIFFYFGTAWAFHITILYTVNTKN